MCAFHMKKAVSENVSTYIPDKNTQNIFLSDLDKLQLSKSSAKWEHRSQDLMEYFRHEWLVLNRYWYEGCAKLVPSTYNALNRKLTRKCEQQHIIGQNLMLLHSSDDREPTFSTEFHWTQVI